MLKRNWKPVRASSQLVLSLLFVVCSAPAQDDAAHWAVARVSFEHGEIAILRADSGEWIPAVTNTPLISGDTIATGENSRLEVQLDYAHVLRLSGNAQAKIATLTDSQIQVQLAHGLGQLVPLWNSKTQVEIDAPNIAVQPSATATCRIQVNST